MATVYSRRIPVISGAGGSEQIHIFHWNPRRPVINRPGVRRVQLRVNNFGDLLGPLIVEAMHRRLGLAGPRRSVQLVTVGSVLHEAQEGAVVWGSGVNGKVPLAAIPDQLDVRAVRGPRTAEVLAGRGHQVPVGVFGDPALLLPILRPDLGAGRRRWALTVVPNLNDASLRPSRNVVHPRMPLKLCLRRIAGSEFVVGSSLHGIIVAEAFGVPARLIASRTEHPFKYRDYYEATGRPGYKTATSVEHALALGPEPPPVFDPQPLMDAFPADLWRKLG